MRKIAVLFLMILFAVVSQAKQPSYRIGMSEWIPWVTLNVAEKKGFWKTEGIDVNVVMYDDYFNVSALASGEIDFSIDLIGAWHSQIVSGRDITLIAETDWSNGGDYYIERPHFDQRDKIIYTYADKLGGLFFIDKVLKKEGRTITDFKISRFDPGYMNAGYKKGTMNRIMSYEPDVFEIIRSGGKVVATTRDFPGVMPDGIAVMTKRMNTIPENDMLKFMRGLIKAHEWVSNPKNKEEMYSIIRNETLKSCPGLTDKDIESMLKNVLIYNKKELFKNNSKNGNIYKYSKEMKEFYYRMYGKEIDFEKKINTTVLLKAYR